VVQKPAYRGIIPPLATPLLTQNSIDLAGLERLIEHTLSAGVHAVLILGTTGEAPSLSHELRLEMIRTSCALVGERVPVLIGVMDTSFNEAVRTGHAAADSGAAALLVVPPYYFTYSQQDLLHYIELLAAEVSLPILLYNIPQYTKVAYSVETVAQASRMERVIGIKDSGGDMSYLNRVIESVGNRPDFAVLIGPEEKLVEGLRAGASGGVCGGANLFPRMFVQIYEAAARADWPAAERLQQLARQVSATLYQTGDRESSYLRGLKTALAFEGICSDLPALPFNRFSFAEREAIEAGLARVRATAGADSMIT
jgi:4-hydroxy-tetrahydrodipicolinate synthase